ncbi:MAG: PilC/PilY family type IV pilus protein [Gallionella sp.]|nr:PilC/PilY family type IV pilus protein [Gallionella sp.]
MTTTKSFKNTALALLFLALTANAHGAVTSLADAPLVTGSDTAVLPNLMFVLDDSGSMDWDYMPDTAKNFSGKYGFNSSHCNGTYYSPNTTYTPPVYSDGTSYPNATFTAAWKDGYQTGLGTVNLSTSFTGGSGSGSSGINLTPQTAFYYTYTGTQTSAAQMNYQSTSGTFYTECNSTIGSAPGSSVFTKTTLSSASVPTTTITVTPSAGAGSPASITVGGSGSTTVSSITVGGVQILPATTSSSRRTSNVATNIKNGINLCTVAATGNCGTTGYSATVSGSVVTITGPGGSGVSAVITKSGSMTFAVNPFPNNTATAVSSITVNGTQLLSGATVADTSSNVVAARIATNITAAAGYSASATGNVVTITGPTSAATYTPAITSTVGAGAMTLTTVAFPAVTSAAQLQNFANWYSYYSNRMLMMKTGAGLAFSPISDNYRVGFLTMNNNVSPGIVEVAPFAGGCAVGSGTCQRDKWYTKLYASNPGNSTPLREALSHVGQYYAHKFGNVTYYKSTLTVGGSGSTEVGSITVNGTEIMDDTSVASTSTSTVAANIAAQINLLDTYGASVSGSVVTINGTEADLGQVPAISKTGDMTVTPTAFTASTTTSTLNGISPADPMQYSCQQNFTILSTDGYWNGSTTYDLNGTAVGQQDGTEQRPMLDGASSTSTVTTPYTTVQRRQTVTSGATVTKTWSKTTTAIGADCTTSSAPSNTLSYPMIENSHKMGLGLKSSDPDSGRCRNLGGSGAGTAWFCRGSSSNEPDNDARQSTVTDSTGKTWYLVSNVSGNTGCVTNLTAFGSGYSASYGACQNGTGVAGSDVTSTPYTQAEVITGATTTELDDYIASQSTSHVVTNGVAGAESSLAPATLTYTLDSHVSTVEGAPTSDTCGGQSAPCPSDAGTWTTGTATTVCTATASLPTPGTTSPTSATSSTGGTTTITVISTVGPTAGTPTPTATTTTGGVSNTLADVAEYYYVTDLRDSSLGNCTGALGTSVCGNNVPSTGLDAASWQHMTTFTLGLGARGRMVYSPTYLTDTSGDFFSVKNGVTANGSTICPWLSSGVCNWPAPASSSINNIDDLWHAAINGRGSYFSATDPVTLASGISSALAGISTRSGASAAATTSNPNVTSGDNFVFSSTFTTTQWDGELVRQQLDLTTGVTSSTNDWCANGPEFKTVNGVTTANCPHPYALDALAVLTAKAASRTIYAYDSTNANGNRLKAFNETNFGANSNFNIPHISTSPDGLTQMLCASASICASAPWQASKAYAVGERFFISTSPYTVYQVATAYTSGATFGATDTTNASVVANPGNDLVNFLRGDRTHEGAETDNTKYYRSRAHILGDIVNAEAVYVKIPLFNYDDTGYTTASTGFTTIKASRQGMVYAAANDGMLHAFYAGDGSMDPATGLTPGATSVTGGNEAWAYIPSLMLPNLYKLADKDYGTTGNHRYFVDGTPVVGDICPTEPTTACTGAQWKTILVGGFNKGGRGYYALDITNPAAPKALWEFTDDNLGYSYGNPKITKLSDGTWVVMVTSGYNNVPNADGAGGDGVGRLFVIKASDGTLLKQISTGVGDTTTPSGLARIAVRVFDTSRNNTAKAVYGGDMLGNLWRFDVSVNSEDVAAVGYDATLDIGGPGNDAQLLTTLIGPTGVVQPITTKPELGDIDGTKVIYVGTGRFLGSTDSADQSTQSIYAIEDPLTVGTTASTPIYANPRTLGTFKNQTPTSTTCPNGSPTTICTVGQSVRTSPNLTVTWGTDHGWYMDLPDTGERANTDPTLSLGTLGFTTNVPNSDACTVGGYSYRYFMDYKTGGAVSTSTTGVVGAKLGNALATRPVYVRLPNGVVAELTRLSTGVTATSQVPIGSGSAAPRRTSWRELIEE